MSDDNNKKDYDVGYGKPPKSTRFGATDGNPGNTKGRPPGRNVLEFDRLSEEALWHCFHESGQKPVSIREDGKELVIPLIMAIAKGMATDAANGDKHARRDYLRYLEKAVKGKDKVLSEVHSILADYRERKLSAMQNPGSLECVNTFYEWFMIKKNLRAMDGEDRWPYEDGEPVTDEDWLVFIEKYELLKENSDYQVSWPLKYADDLEAERIEGMTRKELAQERLRVFKHRKEMREKEGALKWPFLIEEPVDGEDWENLEQYIQDILDGKESSAPWPPSYWDDDPEE
ncbi:MAG: hypothetical protein COA45_11475 [Zetaproteobacteria bacterium]|nr:MAG: hypothetical protein COA45_11475 [Zetaproteobacteria bacterium]